MVNLELYRSFVAVYRIGTVSGAAEHCDLTQPAVSQQLAGLEKKMGKLLFERTPRKMVPTPDGKELYTQIAQAFDVLDNISKVDPIAKTLTLIRIGAPLEYFYEEFIKTPLPDIFRYRFVFDTSDVLLDRLEVGELDIVISTEQKTRKGVVFQKIKEENFLLVGSVDCNPPDGSEDKILHQWLLNQPWISYDVQLPIIRRYWMKRFHERPKILPKLVIPNLHAILKAVQIGKGISVLPDYLCQSLLENQQLRRIDTIDIDVGNSLWLCYKKMGQNKNNVHDFLSLLNINF